MVSVDDLTRHLVVFWMPDVMPAFKDATWRDQSIYLYKLHPFESIHPCIHALSIHLSIYLIHPSIYFYPCIINLFVGLKLLKELTHYQIRSSCNQMGWYAGIPLKSHGINHQGITNSLPINYNRHLNHLNLKKWWSVTTWIIPSISPSTLW